jgi:hypothetical protein
VFIMHHRERSLFLSVLLCTLQMNAKAPNHCSRLHRQAAELSDQITLLENAWMAVLLSKIEFQDVSHSASFECCTLRVQALWMQHV